MENQKIILTGYAKIYFSYYQNNPVVIKESKKRNLINYEHSIYQIINNKCLNIPACYGMMSNNKFSYLILQNTGLSINKIDKWLIYDIYKLYNDISNALNFLHSINIIHGDIKPSNITFNKDENKYYLIDYNLATNNINQYKISKSYFIGNREFSSLSVYNGLNPGARDDFVSLIYVCLYLYTNKLPWKITDQKMTMSNLQFKLFYSTDEKYKDDELIKFLLSKI